MKKIIDFNKYYDDYINSVGRVSIRIDHNTMKQFNLKEDGIVVNKFVYSSHEPVHTHDFVEMCYVEDGSVEHIINGRKVNLERGQMLVFLPGYIHEFNPAGESTMSNIMFSSEILAGTTLLSSNPLEMLSLAASSVQESLSVNVITFSGLNMVYIEQVIGKMVDEFRLKKTGYQEMLKSYLDIMLISIIRHIRSEESMFSGGANSFSKITPKVLEYIENNYDRKLSLSEVAKISFYDPRYFCMLFKESVGKTLTEYLCELRIQKAIEFLNSTDMSVDDISVKVGFSDKKFFYGQFKKIMGTTPAQFRKSEKHEKE